MTQPLKTQLENLKKGCKKLFYVNLYINKQDISTEFICGDRYSEGKLKYCEICQVKISLLSQIIDDLKKEWQRLDRQICNSAFKEFEYERQGLMKFISQITGMSSEELKE